MNEYADGWDEEDVGDESHIWRLFGIYHNDGEGEVPLLPQNPKKKKTFDPTDYVLEHVKNITEDTAHVLYYVASFTSKKALLAYVSSVIVDGGYHRKSVLSAFDGYEFHRGHRPVMNVSFPNGKVPHNPVSPVKEGGQ